MVDGQYRVAQYGQCDGYPDGQGKKALEFAARRLTTPEYSERFRQQLLSKTRFLSDEEVCLLVKGLDDWKTRYPSLSRGTGAKILELIWNAAAEVPLSNAISFAGESLFCEWAYVIDLDKDTLEAFHGFNHKPLAPTERFANAPRNGSAPEYYPIRHLMTWNLHELPTTAEFVRKLDAAANGTAEQAPTTEDFTAAAEAVHKAEEGVKEAQTVLADARAEYARLMELEQGAHADGNGAA
jgi:hypothetical protein